MANNSHKGQNWPYHEDKNGNMVPCASNPCKLHGGTDIMATSPEDATAKKNDNNAWGYKPAEKESQIETKETTEQVHDDNGFKKVDDFVKESTPHFEGSMYNHIVDEDITKDSTELQLMTVKTF